MSGTIIKRGKHSWRLKYEAGQRDPGTGKRQTRFVTVRGSKADAVKELTRLTASVDLGQHVDRTKTTVAEFATRFGEWCEGQVSRKTAERYRQLLKLHVVPRVGAERMQAVKAETLSKLYAALLRDKPEGAGLAARTVKHVHRVVFRMFQVAMKWNLVASNPAMLSEPPRVERGEIEILTEEQARLILDRLAGHELYPITALLLMTGLRRGEALALRWSDIDLEARKLRVERSLEQTDRGAPAFKAPKTSHGRRTISIAPALVEVLRARRRAQQEQQLALGLGKLSDGSLVFCHADGSLLRPDSVSKRWSKTVAALRLPDVTLHALRHTHASQLLASGVDVLTISRRLGHGSPSITLDVYSHLISNTDDRAAAVMQTAFGDVAG